MDLTTNHQPVRLFGIVAALAVCACAPEPSSDSPLVNTEWELVTMVEEGQEFTAPPGSDVPTLAFTSEVVQDGIRRRLNGSGGCNLLAGSYITAAGDSLGVAALARTRKSCPDPIMDFEIRLTRLLVDVTGFRIRGSTLMMDHESGEITFRRATATDATNEG